MFTLVYQCLALFSRACLSMFTPQYSSLRQFFFTKLGTNIRSRHANGLELQLEIDKQHSRTRLDLDEQTAWN